jgi:CheY-like chemotaxis protein
MSKDNGKPLAFGYSEGCERLRPSKTILERWADRDLNRCIADRPRLLRVLVVDDDCDTANSLSQLVKLWGYDARVAYNGATALEAAAAYQPDVLLLDIAMPLMDGNCLARKFRQQVRFQETLMIAISGYADEPHRLSSMLAGFDHYLAKPLELLALEKLLLREQGSQQGTTMHLLSPGEGVQSPVESRQRIQAAPTIN